MVNKVDKNIKSIITKDWKSHFSVLNIINPLNLFRVHDCFLYGIQLDILRGNTEYRIYVKLISLLGVTARIDFNKYVMSQVVTSKKNFPFEIPIAHHKEWYKDALIATELQAPFDLFDSISKERIINLLEINIASLDSQSIIDLPYRECEFLIQFAGLFLDKKRKTQIFEKYLNELERFPEERMNYFVGNKRQWLNNLIYEYNNPAILKNNIKENILLSKLSNISQTKLID